MAIDFHARCLQLSRAPAAFRAHALRIVSLPLLKRNQVKFSKICSEIANVSSKIAKIREN